MYSINKISPAYIFICILLLYSCNSANKTIETDQKTYKPIIETNEVRKLTRREKIIIGTTIVQDIQLYTESCERKKKEKLILNEDQIIFIKTSDKNPPSSLLNFLNRSFNNHKIFESAKDGLAVFKSGLLIGYVHSNENKNGDLITTKIINQNSSKDVTVDLSHSETGLRGVDKTYHLKKHNSTWRIIGCKVNSYN